MTLDSQFWWWFERAAGIVAWVLITLSVAWGLILSARLVTKKNASPWLLDVHRYLGALAFVCTGLHIVGLIADSFVQFGAADILVPMASHWKPGPLAWGVIATYLIVAVELTSLFMRKLPRKLWRAVHMSSFAVFLLVSIHGATAGTDATNAMYKWSAIGLVDAVLFLTIYRLVAGQRVHRRAARAGIRHSTRPAAEVIPEEHTRDQTRSGRILHMTNLIDSSEWVLPTTVHVPDLPYGRAELGADDEVSYFDDVRQVAWASPDHCVGLLTEWSDSAALEDRFAAIATIDHVVATVEVETIVGFALALRGGDGQMQLMVDVRPTYAHTDIADGSPFD